MGALQCQSAGRSLPPSAGKSDRPCEGKATFPFENQSIAESRLSQNHPIPDQHKSERPQLHGVARPGHAGTERAAPLGGLPRLFQQPFHQLGRRDWFADQIALRVVAAGVAQEGEAFGVLHPFGDHLEA